MGATAKAGQNQQQKRGGLGLDKVGDLASLLKKPTPTANDGGPRMFDMSLIDEDPAQPRGPENPGFSPESIAELGATIKRRGRIKTPISLRDNPDAPGRFLINHGARRYRGTKWAGFAQIPGFLDNDYDQDDQVIENIQRDGLTAREIADHIGKRISQGFKKGEIAEALGKSAAFISQHVALLDLPEPIAEAFYNDRVRDVTVVNELVKAHKANPKEVEDWLDDPDQEITRGSIKLLREFIDSQSADRDPNTVDGLTGQTDSEAGHQQNKGEGKADGGKGTREPDPDKLKKAIVQVRYSDRPARLMLNKRPPAEGFAWLKYDDDGQEVEASLSDVQLVALVEG